MKFWNCCIRIKIKILVYNLQNVRISYDKINHNIFEMFAILDKIFQHLFVEEILNFSHMIFTYEKVWNNTSTMA